MDSFIDDGSAANSRTRELERRLLDAAEALLAHQGTSFAFVPIPGRLPVRCVAVGDLARLRDLVRSDNLYA